MKATKGLNLQLASGVSRWCRWCPRHCAWVGALLIVFIVYNIYNHTTDVFPSGIADVSSRLPSGLAGAHVEYSLCLDKPIRTQEVVWDSWQKLTIIGAFVNIDLVVYNAYFDDRDLDVYTVRAFIVAEGYLYSHVLYCHLWYAGLNEPIVILAKLTRIEISHYKLNGKHYVQYMITCDVMRLSNSVPLYIAFAQNKCGSLTKPIRITQVLDPDSTSVNNYSNSTESLKIAVCLSSQYGSVNDDDVPFVVQWMEALLLFGVSRVFFYNASLQDTGEAQLYTRTLEYYQQNNVLDMINLALPVEKFSNLDGFDLFEGSNEYNAAEIVRMIATNDCLYKNRNMYPYLIHMDRDELVVPFLGPTYQDFLRKHLASEPKHEAFSSLSVPSAFFYKTFKPSHPNVPEYLPLNRLSYRTPVEKRDKNSAGFIKSFVNTAICVSIWSHRCREGPKGKDVVYMEADDILVYHFRSLCRMGNRCAEEWSRRQRDDRLIDKYGDDIKERTVKVLTLLAYPM